MTLVCNKQQDLKYLAAKSTHLLFTLLLLRFLESNALKKITDEMAAITSKLGIILQQKKILQLGQHAAKLDLSGVVTVMENGRVKFVMPRLPMASLKEKLCLGYQATGHKRCNA